MIVGFITWPIEVARAVIGAQTPGGERAARSRETPALQNLRTVLEMPSTLDENLKALMTHLESIDRAFWATHDQVARVNDQLDRVFRYLEPLERRAERIQQAIRRGSRAGTTKDTKDTTAAKRTTARRKPPAPKS